MRARTGSLLVMGATMAGALLAVNPSPAQADAWPIVRGAVSVALVLVVLLAPVVVIEAIGYRALVGAGWGRSWLWALCANVVGVLPMASLLFFLMLPWSKWAPRGMWVDVLMAVDSLAVLLWAKVRIVLAIKGRGPWKRPLGRVALGLSAFSTVLVIAACGTILMSLAH